VYLRERIRKEYVHAASREGSARVEKGSKEANHPGNLFREKLRKLPPKLDNSDQPLVQFKIQCTHFLHCGEEEKESMLRRLVDRHE